MKVPVSFDLHIAKTKNGEFKEVLIIPDSKALYKQEELGFMGIANSFLSAGAAHQIPVYPEGHGGKEQYYNKVLNELISCCYINIGESVMEYAAETELIWRPAIFERPLSFEQFTSIGVPLKEVIARDRPLERFLNEIEVLYLALDKWLMYSPKIKKSPSERYCWAYEIMSQAKDLPLPVSTRTLPAFLSRLDLHDLAVLYGIKHLREGSLKQSLTGLGTGRRVKRTRDDPYDDLIITKEIVQKNILSRSYISQSGLLPLAWAEILYCVENDLSIRQCPECGSLFYIKSNGKYCSDRCKATVKKKQDNKRYRERVSKTTDNNSDNNPKDNT